jgi:glycosyltransferase involved in cell wall biosynthesis
VTGAPRVCALIPAFNEARRIGATVAAVRSRPEVSTIVVADDGSTDATAARAKEAGADIVLNLRHGGKGAALSEAYRAAGGEAEVFLLLDADLGSSATELVKLLQPLLAGVADMTIATIPPDPDAHRERRAGGHGLVVGLARRAIERRTGLVVSQPLSGQRALRREVVDSIGGRFADGFGVEVALTIAASHAGFRILEVPAEFRHAVTASNIKGALHRARQFVHVARAARK